MSNIERMTHSYTTFGDLTECVFRQPIPSHIARATDAARVNNHKEVNMHIE